MSGGVDSSVAAALLVEQGHDVVGVTLRVWPWSDAAEPARRFGTCCGTEATDDARRVARTLGIPHYVLDTEREFDRTVVDQFVDEYRHGRTPVPCLACNTELKFGSLLRRAGAWDAAAVATGHYARVTRDAASERYLLWKGRDERKDQSDFLWPLSQTQLAAARFPVGELTKDEVRAQARRLGLATADKPESQEICFIPDDDYRGFLRRRDPDMFVPGAIVDRQGASLGRHAGLANFTVGQKRGLGLATGRRLYVLDLDVGTNTVTVGSAADLEQSRLVARAVNFIAGAPPIEPVPIQARIRHRHTPAAATVRALEGSRAEVVFDEPQRAVAPGQSVVFYRGDLVVGGGVITR
jgi:tRNA-specific 2-thiouridylase